MLLMQNQEQKSPTWPVWQQAFRPMFLCASLMTILAILLWGAMLAGWWTIQPFGHALFWHGHEMLFGFVCAIIVGFLLTAVQNWTGVRATHGYSLIMLTVIWALGRFSLLFGAQWPTVLVVVLDLSFLPLCAFFLERILWQAKQKRNLFFVPVLLLLTLCNGLMYIGLLYEHPLVYSTGQQGAIWLIVLLMSLIGGRVIPMFTANGTKTQRVLSIMWLDRAALSLLWLLALLFVTGISHILPKALISLLCLATAGLVGYRALRWKPWITTRVPLLWSLHIAYAFIPLGLLLYAAHYADLAVPLSVAFHTFTAGAMGTMILSMIARVALGHSGRPLIPSKWMTLAFVFVITSALSRILGVWLWPQALTQWIGVGIIFWFMAYFIFSLLYFKILTHPRADGQPG